MCYLQLGVSSNTPFLPCEEGTHYHRCNHEDHVECLIAESVLVKFWHERASDIERKNIENSCASLMPKLRSKIFEIKIMVVNPASTYLVACMSFY